MYLKKIQQPDNCHGYRKSHTNSAGVRRSLRISISLSLLLVAACGSSGSDTPLPDDEPLTIASTDTIEPNIENTDDAQADVTPQINESSDIEESDNGDAEAADNTAVITEEEVSTEEENSGSDNEQALPPMQVPITAESSPVGLLLDEIRLAVGDPLLALNARLSGGEFLDTDENNCLGTFDPATGQQLTQLNCAANETSLSVYASDLQLISGQFSDSADCQSAISEGNVNACRLESASMLLPIVWIPAANPAPSQIGTVFPLQGAGFEYNLSADGILVIQNMSALFQPFHCEINIDSGSLITTDATVGNCRSEVSRLTGRLFDLRVGNPPTAF